MRWEVESAPIKLLAYRIFDPAKANVLSKLTLQIAKPTDGLHSQQGAEG
jgi:hypothetical protein